MKPTFKQHSPETGTEYAIYVEAPVGKDAAAPLPARLFLSVGEEDSASMTGDLTLLEQQLAAKPFDGLEITAQRFPYRNHFNILPDAFRAGLVNLLNRS